MHLAFLALLASAISATLIMSALQSGAREDALHHSHSSITD